MGLGLEGWKGRLVPVGDYILATGSLVMMGCDEGGGGGQNAWRGAVWGRERWRKDGRGVIGEGGRHFEADGV